MHTTLPQDRSFPRLAGKAGVFVWRERKDPLDRCAISNQTLEKRLKNPRAALNKIRWEEIPKQYAGMVRRALRSILQMREFGVEAGKQMDILKERIAAGSVSALLAAQLFAHLNQGAGSEFIVVSEKSLKALIKETLQDSGDIDSIISSPPEAIYREYEAAPIDPAQQLSRDDLLVSIEESFCSTLEIMLISIRADHGNQAKLRIADFLQAHFLQRIGEKDALSADLGLALKNFVDSAYESAKNTGVSFSVLGETDSDSVSKDGPMWIVQDLLRQAASLAHGDAYRQRNDGVIALNKDEIKKVLSVVEFVMTDLLIDFRASIEAAVNCEEETAVAA